LRNFGRTLESLRRANVARISWHPNGKPASVEFVPAVQADPKPLAQPDERTKTFAGTPFPDDKSPLNPLDTLLHVPKYDASEVDA
jgi:hypothetical protein